MIRQKKKVNHMLLFIKNNQTKRDRKRVGVTKSEGGRELKRKREKEREINADESFARQASEHFN
jgi:hypothetical protein